jgi:hypothetical protein
MGLRIIQNLHQELALTLAQRNALVDLLAVLCPALMVGAFRKDYLVQVLGTERGQAALKAFEDCWGSHDRRPDVR